MRAEKEAIELYHAEEVKAAGSKLRSTIDAACRNLGLRPQPSFEMRLRAHLVHAAMPDWILWDSRIVENGSVEYKLRNLKSTEIPDADLLVDKIRDERCTVKIDEWGIDQYDKRH
jgi:hypothetical protein